MFDKSFIVTIKMLCDSLDESGLGVRALVPTSRKSTYDIFRSDTLKLLAYLATIDGNCNEKELQFINEYLSYDYSIKDLERLIKNDASIKNIEESVPVFMKIVVNADNIRFKRNVPHGEASCITMHSFFNMIGREFLSCDDYISEIEEKSLNTILATMQSYYEQNDEEFKASVQPAGTGGASSQPAGQTSVQGAGDDKPEDFGTLEELLEELNSLIGLEKVKKDVNSLINLVKVMKMREERGMKEVDVSLHLVFSGNPGTGKTTVARLLSRLYCRIGVLSKGHLVEVDRSGLVSGYVGQTALKTQEVIQKSIGGVLFIDEAYALTANKDGNDFGMEAVDTLLKGMEDHRDDLAVIVAGYPQLMEDFLGSNPGLRSRFNKFIYFDDYTPEELFGIFKMQCKKNGYAADDEALEYAKEFFTERYNNRDEKYANARDVRNFFEKAVVEQANRIAKEEAPTDEELAALKLSDLTGIEL
ncbi:MAG: AAA family ATPase [Firmicutes bacterium]|nr:AAA family ATPase [Bacillota bacterium]